MKRHKKRKKYQFNAKRFFAVLFSFAMILFGIYYIVKRISKPANDLITLNFDFIPITSSHRGVIFRNEILNNTLNAGVFSSDVEQGDRVKSKQVIGTLSVGNAAQNKENQKGASGFLLDEANLNEEANEVYQLLLQSVKERDFISSSFLKEELESKLQRMKKLHEEGSQNAFELKQKQNKNVGNADAQAGEMLSIQTHEPGVISFFIDSLENDVNYNNRYKIDYEKIWNSDVRAVDTRGRSVQIGEPVFKIIKPSVWYIACKVPREHLKLYKQNSKVFLVSEDKNFESIIYEVFDAHHYAVVILKMSTQLPMLFDSRIVDVTLIRNEVRGLPIPKTAIIKVGNDLGVYALDLDNRLKYVPISVIEDDGDRYIVQEGTIHKKSVNDEIKIIQTVKNGDMIIDNASEHKEGEFIGHVKK